MIFMVSKRSLVSILLILVGAWVICLPSLALRTAWLAGNSGFCPLRFVILFKLISVILAALACGFVIVYSRPTSKLLLCASVVSLLALVGVFFQIQRTVSSGSLLQNYCRGLSNAIGKKVDAPTLRKFFSSEIDANGASDEIYYQVLSNSVVNQIFPSQPSILIYKPDDAQRSSASVFWKCAGGGIGIIYAETPPPKRGWLDEAVLFSEGIWIVTRQE
jgi:hypothetical protein